MSEPEQLIAEPHRVDVLRLDDAAFERIADRVHLFFNMNWERFGSGDADLFKRQLSAAIRSAAEETC